MEVVSNSYMPGDPRLVEQLVYELKSQGIFDQFRKECIADVDTKPAYQNLRQRVEGSVTSFLSQQSWRPDMNKNQVREQLRKNIYESGYLETGVERIVDQVVNPKINTIFLPQVEDVVYRFLGIEKPNRVEVKKELKINVMDLLPTDLEAISPESDHTKDDNFNFNDSINSESKMEEDESPAFEPIDLQNQNSNIQHDENSGDSHLSGFSGLQSHDSNPCPDSKICQMELSNQDSQISQNSSESRLSIITSEDNTKMEIRDDSNSKLTKTSDSSSQMEIFYPPMDQTPDQRSPVQKDEELKMDSEADLSNNCNPVEEKILEKEDNEKVAEEIKVKQPEEKQGEDKKSNEKKYVEKKSRSSDKHSSKDKKDDKYRKSSSSSGREKEKSSSKHSSSVSSKDRDKHREKKESRNSSSSSNNKEKNDKDESKNDKEKVKSESKNDKDKEKSEKDRDKKEKDKYEKDKTDKSKSIKDKDKDKSSKEKDKVKSSSGSSSSSINKHSSSKEKEKSSSSLKSESSKRDKEKSSSSSSKDSKSRSGDSKSKSSSSDKHRKEDKDKSTHSIKYSNSSSSSSSKRDKDKDKKRVSKKDSKDDHYSSKYKKNDRRSTDRDSNDGKSSRQSHINPLVDTNSSQAQKSNQESSSSNSGSGSGDSGTSDQTEHVVKSPVKIIEQSENVEVSTTKLTVDLLKFKYIKPKFASNFQEARKLMKIRKQLAKLERQNQLSLAQIEVPADIPIVNGISCLEKDSVETVEDIKSDVKSDANNEVRSDAVTEVKNVIEVKNAAKCEVKSVVPLAEPVEDVPNVETLEITQCKMSPKDDTLLLQSKELSKENWEALEARLAQEMSNINYDSYESPYDDDFGECKSTDSKKLHESASESCVVEVNVDKTVNPELETVQDEDSEKTKIPNKVESIVEAVEEATEVSKVENATEEAQEVVQKDLVVDLATVRVEESNVVKNIEQNENQHEAIMEVEISNKKELEIRPEIENSNNSELKVDEQMVIDDSDKTGADSSTSEMCTYLEPQSPGSKKNLEFLYKYIEKLEQEVKHSVKTFQNNFVPAKQRLGKRKLVENVDFKNNNKAHYEQSTDVKKRRRSVLPNPNSVISKANKEKLCNSSDIAPSDSFSLPLSPAESDKSNDKKDEESPKAKQKRESVGRTIHTRSQRYSSEDLYKPRPNFMGSRRSRGAKNTEK